MGTNKVIELSAYREERQTPPVLSVSRQAPRLIPIDRFDRGRHEAKSVRRMLSTQEFRRRIACGDYHPDPHAIAMALIDHLFDDTDDPYQSR